MLGRALLAAFRCTAAARCQAEYKCARAQDKAGKAREDSLSEEKRQANQAEVKRLQLELHTKSTKATDIDVIECDDKCVANRRNR